MALNAFRDNLGERPGVRYRTPNADQKAEADLTLLDHMREISGDPDGSDPSLYLSEADAATLANFVHLAGNLGWPGSSKLETRTGRKEHAVWKGPMNTAKSGLYKVLRASRYEDRKGYVIGSLSTSQLRQHVAVCEDGLLRSWRGRELQASHAVGWGRLPDPEFLEDARPNGYNYGVDYTQAGMKQIKGKSASIAFREILLQQIPKECLAGVDLNAYGLGA